MARVLWIGLSKDDEVALHRAAKAAAAVQGLSLRRWVMHAIAAQLAATPEPGDVEEVATPTTP